VSITFTFNTSKLSNLPFLINRLTGSIPSSCPFQVLHFHAVLTPAWTVFKMRQIHIHQQQHRDRHTDTHTHTGYIFGLLAASSKEACVDAKIGHLYMPDGISDAQPKWSY